MYESQLGEIKTLDRDRARRRSTGCGTTGSCPTARASRRASTQVKVGDKLPRRVIGPHSIASFTTEYRAFLFNIWGTFGWVAPAGVKDPWINQDPGWVRGLRLRRGGRPDRSAQARRALRRARRAATSTPARRARSAWRGPTATARRWAPGAPTTWPTGPVTTAWCAIRKAELPRARLRGRRDLLRRRGDRQGRGVGLGRAGRPGRAAPDQPGRRPCWWTARPRSSCRSRPWSGEPSGPASSSVDRLAGRRSATSRGSGR